MSNHATTSPAVDLHGAARPGPALILCEHASNHIPARYDGLGLDPQDRESHAAWDPGALAVARHLSDALNSPLIASAVSRLVYDCNRPPEAASAMPAKSELIDVPGNQNLTKAQRQERVDTVYTPFCTAVTTQISAQKPKILITMHSFTPVYYGKPRACEIGILHDADTRLADTMLANANLTPHLRVERNVPYGPEDGVTHSLKLHGLGHSLPNVMVEIRNDLIATPDQQKTIAGDLLHMIQPFLTGLEPANQ
jgi:predicted N-formylglutamate amidohydrolase